jgi:glycosyltransferase involved in cell wall biosynthesis
MDRRAARLRSVCGAIDSFVAPTRFARDRAIEFGVPAARVRVSPYGAVEGPHRPRPSGPRRRIGYVGTLAPHKGVHILVEAFRGLPAEDATLDLYGSPSVHPHYVQELRKAVIGDPRIRFRGPFADGGQKDAYAQLDVLVVPSLWWENSPLTVLEALSQGVPVIASGTGGVPELIADGDTGLLVRAGDVAALRAALDDVVSGRRLAEARAAIAVKTVAEGARELLELYSGCSRRANM